MDLISISRFKVLTSTSNFINSRTMPICNQAGVFLEKFLKSSIFGWDYIGVQRGELHFDILRLLNQC